MNNSTVVLTLLLLLSLGVVGFLLFREKKKMDNDDQMKEDLWALTQADPDKSAKLPKNEFDCLADSMAEDGMLGSALMALCTDQKNIEWINKNAKAKAVCDKYEQNVAKAMSKCNIA